MNLKKLRIVWVALLIGLIAWLLWRAIVPSGKIGYESNLFDNNYFIGKLSPVERIEASNRIIAEPVYFSLYTPRSFQKARLTINFKTTAPLVEVGVRRDKTVWSYDMQPAYSALLESLRTDENTIVQEDALLWQKNKRYTSIENFLTEPPAFNRVASYRYALPFAYSFSGDARTGSQLQYILGLRGAYQFYTYSDGSPIDLDLFVRDRNENSDLDPIELNMYSGTELVYSKKLDDTTEEGERRLDIVTPNLKRGVYRVEVKVNDDIVTTKLLTRQAKIAFSGRLWLNDASRKNISLYNDGSRFSAQTLNPQSLQSISIADQQFELASTYEQQSYIISNPGREVQLIHVAKGDVILASDGLWSFSPEAFFNPTIRQMPPARSRAELDVDYLIAHFNPVKLLDDGSFQAVLEFDLRGAYREKNKYSFMISAPNAKLDQSPLEIESIAIQLEGASLYDYVTQIFKRN